MQIATGLDVEYMMGNAIINDVRKSFEGNSGKDDSDDEEETNNLSILTVQLCPNDTSSEKPSFPIEQRESKREFHLIILFSLMCK